MAMRGHVSHRPHPRSAPPAPPPSPVMPCLRPPPGHPKSSRPCMYYYSVESARRRARVLKIRSAHGSSDKPHRDAGSKGRAVVRPLYQHNSLDTEGVERWI